MSSNVWQSRLRPLEPGRHLFSNAPAEHSLLIDSCLLNHNKDFPHLIHSALPPLLSFHHLKTTSFKLYFSFIPPQITKHTCDLASCFMTEEWRFSYSWHCPQPVVNYDVARFGGHNFQIGLLAPSLSLASWQLIERELAAFFLMLRAFLALQRLSGN